ncbi:hypothetical protein QTP88_025659 [Uroleucon formosanum]
MSIVDAECLKNNRCNVQHGKNTLFIVGRDVMGQLSAYCIFFVSANSTRTSCPGSINILLFYEQLFGSTHYILFIEYCVATAEFGQVARGSFLTGNVWGVSVSGRGQSENERLNPTRLRYHVSHATWLKPYRGGDESCMLLFSRIIFLTQISFFHNVFVPTRRKGSPRIGTATTLNTILVSRIRRSITWNSNNKATKFKLIRDFVVTITRIGIGMLVIRIG